METSGAPLKKTPGAMTRRGSFREEGPVVVTRTTNGVSAPTDTTDATRSLPTGAQRGRTCSVRCMGLPRRTAGETAAMRTGRRGGKEKETAAL